MNLELLGQGLVAMGIGMGVVITFLVILIVSMTIMSSIVGYLNKIFPEVVPAPAKSKKAISAGKEDEQIALAIAVALSRA